MIVKCEFDDQNDLVILFGSTLQKHWHFYLREYVNKYKEHLPTKAHRVTVCEMTWPRTKRGLLNKWIGEDQFKDEIAYYDKLTFYRLPAVEEKVNHILFTNCF